jgi:hypothetical protein
MECGRVQETARRGTARSVVTVLFTKWRVAAQVRKVVVLEACRRHGRCENAFSVENVSAFVKGKDRFGELGRYLENNKKLILRELCVRM